MLRPVRARRAARPRLARGRRRERTAPGRSWHVLLIALGLLLAQGPALLHLLLVPHATCEHGELVETATPGRSSWGTHESVPPRSPEDVRPNRSNQAQIERARGDRAGHDHCDALALRHRVPEVGPSVAAASLVWIVPIEARGERAETRPVPLLSLAPKGSPPAA